MMKLNRIAAVVFATVLAGTGAAFAEEASDNGGKDAAAIAAAKVSPSQAIQNAEAKGGGKAVSLDLVSSDGNMPYYHVELVAADGSEHNLAVDASTGEVMKAVGANDDGDDEDGQD